MGIVVKRFPEYGLTLDIWRGTVTPEQVIEHFEGMSLADAGLRISFVDRAANLYAMDIAHIPALKRAANRLLNELYADRPVTSAIVCSPGQNRPVMEFWLRYAWPDPEEGRHAVVFTSLDEACDWLGLSEAARQQVIEALEAEALTPSR